jgi:hypothetical protein
VAIHDDETDSRWRLHGPLGNNHAAVEAEAPEMDLAPLTVPADPDRVREVVRKAEPDPSVLARCLSMHALCGYRTEQNYVGETVGLQKERIHFVCPKPEDLTGMMAGLIAAHKRMEKGDVPAVVHAAAVAYGFVFLHPFEDGNGRIHRFLIHNILARRGFTPTGLIFPVSAAMLKNLADYDGSLEAFSRPLMTLVEYSMDAQGRMTVENDTANWYRFIDMTPQVEALFRFIEQTIGTELVEELAFLANYDQTKKAIQEVVDMPDRKIDLFIQACMQNNGRLSASKRVSHFDFLSDEEVTHLEDAVRSAYDSRDQ